MDYKNKKVIVVGMAKSGVAAAVLLCKLGAEVTIYDAKKKSELAGGLFAELDQYKYTDMTGRDILPMIDTADVLVLSPGVPLDLPFIRRAKELGRRVIAEIELGYEYSKADLIAITGTNGKTTTTDLTGVIFKNAGYNTFVLGNIGVPIAQEALNTKKGDVIVAETAALQLDTIEKYHPCESALLNITEDHLNRYGTMENYIAAKARVFENQIPEDICVLNYENEYVRALAPRVKAQVFWFSTKRELEQGAFVRDGSIVFKKPGKDILILPADEVRIPGEHNLENALAATILAVEYGIAPEIVAQTLKTYAGVEHRIEFVRTVNGIDFINDSKGTNPDATIKAIQAMKKPTVLILGGSDKKTSFIEMYEAMTPLIKHVVLLGETAPQLEEAAKKTGYCNYVRADSFRDAVMQAYRLAEPGDNVLLSPACASFDMFDNFEQRGEVFKQIVRELV